MTAIKNKQMVVEYKSAIGQDSHCFEPARSKKPLVLAGITIPGCVGLKGNSDADVVLHALTNAISGVSGVNVLGSISDDMCLKKGITNSNAYLQKALQTLDGYVLSHISVSIEAHRPRLSGHIDAMKDSLAKLCRLKTNQIGITATTGEGLTSFGKGLGMQAFVVITAVSKTASFTPEATD